MNELASYFEEGLSVSEIAVNAGTTEDAVREVLRSSGVSIPYNSEVDVVTEVLKERGYKSFHDFVATNGFLRPIKDQARDLGVSRYVLAKLFDAYRHYIAGWQYSSGDQKSR